VKLSFPRKLKCIKKTRINTRASIIFCFCCFCCCCWWRLLWNGCICSDDNAKTCEPKGLDHTTTVHCTPTTTTPDIGDDDYDNNNNNIGGGHWNCATWHRETWQCGTTGCGKKSSPL